jgi:hypothetical protein
VHGSLLNLLARACCLMSERCQAIDVLLVVSYIINEPPTETANMHPSGGNKTAPHDVQLRKPEFVLSAAVDTTTVLLDDLLRQKEMGDNSEWCFSRAWQVLQPGHCQ